MSHSHKEGVLSRWSRLKLESVRATSETEESTEQVATNLENVTRDAGKVDPPEREGEALAELPPLDELGLDSDFQGFMDPEVDDDLRRAALKKLFSDPHFNVTDGLDVYAEDYTKLESMTPAMVAGLKHARRLLFGDVDGDEQADITRQANTLEGPVDDEAIKEATLSAYKEDRDGEDGELGNGEARDAEAENSAELAPSPDADKSKT